MEYQHMKLIHIDWEGPYTLENLRALMNEETDYGIYQVYGKHPVYGSNVLLYIGKADMQTIGKRISQENWWNTNDSNRHLIYAGRLMGEQTPEEIDWSIEIDLAEKLLIYVHKPAYNSQNLSNIPHESLQDIHILNWGSYRDLFPEVSGLRWTSKLDELEHEVYRL
ncbi:hypothetical protein MHZ92_07750 [Sporosarcina sp. ACRSL]|uniref:hypothetical protein n=1 Tax=Sporosarcina sp. ACRSL TaxID=2918215 RepID=UPI001EF48E80|nr:hypothetical protein [Sporosarcina sp. ACRSL]MCG7344021.1 hypothetical protein [Sporosarcina sp. ACRSL]